MSMLGKIFTALKGSAVEAGTAFIDKNAIRILEQEMRDAREALNKARDETAGISAKRKMKEDEAARFAADAEKYLTAAKQALEQGNEDLAREVAQRVADLEEQGATANEEVARLKEVETRMKAQIRQIQTKIDNLKREVESVKANEALLNAQAATIVTGAGVAGALGSAADSLDRLRQKQAERQAKMAAAEEMEEMRTGGDLDAKLKAAGIGGSSASADSVLARLKG